MTTTFYDHWRDVPEKAWRWPNFSPAEIACRGTGKLLVNEPALDKLAGAAGPAGQAADRPLCVSQPGTQPRRWWRDAVQAHGRRGLRHRNVEPRSGGIRGGGAGRSGSLGSASIRARGSCMSISARCGSGVSGSRSGRLPSPRTRRRARGSGTSRTMKRWRRGRVSRRWARPGWRVAQSGPDRDPDRHPAAGPVSRHAALGVHRGGARGIAVTIYARLDDWKRGRR